MILPLLCTSALFWSKELQPKFEFNTFCYYWFLFAWIAGSYLYPTHWAYASILLNGVLLYLSFSPNFNFRSSCLWLSTMNTKLLMLYVDNRLVDTERKNIFLSGSDSLIWKAYPCWIRNRSIPLNEQCSSEISGLFFNNYFSSQLMWKSKT